MTHSDERLPSLADALLERLVDGELDDAQRRDVLQRLDHEADGWRRCALTFLESQCLAAELGGLTRQLRPQQPGLPQQLAPAARTHSDVTTTAVRPSMAALVSSSHETEPPRVNPAGSVEAHRIFRRGWPRLARLGTVLGMAASFLTALVLGVIVGPRFIGRDGGGPLVVSAPVEQAKLAAIKPSHDVRVHAVSPGQRPDLWQTVTVSLPGARGGQDESIRVPAVERDRFDADWVRNLPGPLPAEVLQALRQSGHEVNQVRDVVPIRLHDGRQLFVPIDQVEVQPVSVRAFQ